MDLAIDSTVDGAGPARIANDLDLDVQSIIQVDMPPWADSYEVSSTETDGQFIVSSLYSIFFTLPRSMGR